ncbi:hypothetical protein GCM10010277_87570 [Streptomyces longisporoflavus]|nr:hypothetical protein GCM10010277_87570 [Streptomyces longisporoflavus]
MTSCPMTTASLRLAATERAPEAAMPRAGPAVVFLHGLGCERGQFVRQLEGLDPGLQLLSLDLPGHGESPELCAPRYTIASMTRAVGSELRARGYRSVVLVGHSAGGLIALQTAVDLPALVHGVVVLDTNIAIGEADRQANRIRARESETNDWRSYFMASMASAWGEGTAATAQERAFVFDALERAPEHVVRPLWHDILMFKPELLWRRCRVPSLYLRSKRDTNLTLLQSLNPLISTADLRPYCDGHWPHLQCPGVVNTFLHNFLAQLTVDNC